MRLQDKVAIVTGAGGGLGRAVAELFSKEGASVVIVELDQKAGEEAANAITSSGGKSIFVQANVAERAQADQVVEETLKKFGKIDILINNAGITRTAMLHKMTEEQWDLVISVHLKGTFNFTQAVANHMMERKQGKIINVTSAAGLVGTIGQVNYSAAKGGIVSLTKSCARELAKYGINVNVVAPLGETKMTENIRTNEKFRDQYLARIPMGRFGKPEEIAFSFLFLASDEANYITGQTLNVDGGLVI